MCGLAGYVGISARYGWEVLRRMTDEQAHRGPGGQGYYAEALVGLAHCAIGGRGGRQPMVSVDLRYALVHDGEIDNHAELRAELTDLGYDFATDTDAEVVFAAYQEWGGGAFDRLDGTFALAVADADTGEVVLARDRRGGRPLYLAEDGDGRVAFASEIRSVLASGILGRLGPGPTVEEYLSAEISDDSPWTFFAGVTRVLPGQTAVIARDGQIRRHRLTAVPDMSMPFGSALDHRRVTSNHDRERPPSRSPSWCVARSMGGVGTPPGEPLGNQEQRRRRAPTR